MVRDSNVPANFLGAHEGADVEIGKLDNAETFERLRQAAEPDPLMGGFEVKPAIEESVAAANKRGSAQGNGSLLQESPPARGLQIRPRRYELLESPTHRTCDVIDRAQQYCDQESKERTHQPQPKWRFQQGCPEGQFRTLIALGIPSEQIEDEQEKIDQQPNCPQALAPALARNHHFTQFAHTADPEKLAGNQHHEDGEDEQKNERARLAQTGGQPEGAKGDQRESDHTRMSSEETDHLCHLRAGKVRRRGHLITSLNDLPFRILLFAFGDSLSRCCGGTQAALRFF